MFLDNDKYTLSMFIENPNEILRNEIHFLTCFKNGQNEQIVNNPKMKRLYYQIDGPLP